jgi:hypothetical protein
VPAVGSAVWETATHSNVGGVPKPDGTANWLMSQRSDRWSYRTIGSPSFRVSHGVRPEPAHNELMAEGPASDVPLLSKTWKEEFTI